MFGIFNLLNLVISKSSNNLEDLFLVQPYVNGKGDSSLVNFYGDFSIVSYGGDQHIKLGHMSSGTRGFLIYKSLIGKDSFQIEFKISMENLKSEEKGSGMMIFFSDTENIELGSFYGVKPEFEGFSIIFDISEGYNVNVLVDAGKINGIPGKSTKNSYRFYDKDEVSVKVIQDANELKVVIFDDYEELIPYKSNDYKINKQSFIGVSGYNGNKSSGCFYLLSVEPSNIKLVPTFFEKGERESSSKMIWLVFILGAAGLVYYLYDTQIKKNL